MLIDWFTVAAQIVNFLILVWLLKRFLYGRIIRAIDARESLIAARLSEAAAKEKAAAEQLALCQAKVLEIDEQRERMLNEARIGAAAARDQMMQEARKGIAALESAWREDLDREREAFLLELRQRAAAEILAIARRVVADLACIELQKCAVRVFLERVRSLDSETWRSLANCELQVRTAFDLSDDMRAEIRQTIDERLEKSTRLRFDRAPALGWGIELRGNGRRLGWNAEAYMDQMEQDLRAALERLPEVKAHAGAA